MTRILLFVDRTTQGFVWLFDPRSPWELMMRINTAQLRLGETIQPNDERPQSAMIHYEFDMISVAYIPPPADLTETMYRALFGYAHDQTPAEIAVILCLDEKEVYCLLDEVRCRLHMPDLWEMRKEAISSGIA
jgi:hypothetical protein